MDPRIFVCEPCCTGFEHVPFNAALIRALQIAYPACSFAFVGEEDHTRRVIDRLRHGGANALPSRVAARLPAKGFPGIRRFGVELKLFWRLYRLARGHSTQCVVVSCVAGSTLLALKLVMGCLRSRIPTLAIPHDALRQLSEPHPRRPWNRLLGMSCAVRFPAPENLRIAVLGDSILGEVSKLSVQTKGWHSLEHPYAWSEEGPGELPAQGPLRFGFLGASSKGFDVFCRVAESAAARGIDARFILAGFRSPGWTRAADCSAVEGAPGEPLEPQEYARRLSSLHYCVWLGGDVTAYRLLASATFLDALSFLKPCIALRGRYVEHYFDRLGDIGHLCDDEASIVDLVETLVRERPVARYRQQVSNIRRGRVLFEPRNVAVQLREILT